MLQYPSVTPVNGVVLSPDMFGYSRLVIEVFDACVLMLFHTCFESTCSLADVHLSACAWYFIDDVCLLLHREGVFDFSEERTEGGSGLEHRSDVEVLTHLLDLLTNASYIGEVDSGWPLLLPLFLSCSLRGLAAEAEWMKERG